MIRISTGKVGSGKTLVEVKRILEHPDPTLKHYTNIEFLEDKDNRTVLLKPENFILREQIGVSRDGEPKYKYSPNVDFWRKLPKPLNCVVDEAHSVLSSRRSMSKINLCVTDILALIRKLISSEYGAGEITFITQLPYRLDRIIRDMADEIILNICTWRCTCPKCFMSWYESSESARHTNYCLCCGVRVKRDKHNIISLHFNSIEDYIDFAESGIDSAISFEDGVHNPSHYFGKYRTYQISNMLLEFT